MSPAPRFKRILLKLSGEVLMGDGGGLAIDPAVTARVAAEIADVKAQGFELCIVVGGGNIFRGISGAARGMERATGDYMGMLATVMNALAVQNALEQIGVETRVQSAIPMSSVCEPFIRRRAMRHLEKGRVVIFAAGVGSPFFTTDSGAALRAAEMNCDALFKGTSVDGVYDADTKKDPNAKRYAVINLGLIEKFIAAGKLDISVELTEDVLIAAGLTSHLRDGIRILGKGVITSAVKLNVTGASASAIEAVAAAGGTLTTAPVLEPFGKSVRKVPLKV